jgi:hypothetical protein
MEWLPHPIVEGTSQGYCGQDHGLFTSATANEVEKQRGQYLDLICDESLTCHGLNSNLGHFCGFIFIFVSCGESCLLVLWCVGGRCGMVGND